MVGKLDRQVHTLVPRLTQPCAAQPSRHALNCGTLGPIERDIFVPSNISLTVRPSGKFSM